jgi:acyl dehydratase
MTAVSVPSPVRVTTAELPALVGRVLGHSAWHTVTQAHVNAFGAATHDVQWIHTDPARAKNGPYGPTIAHAYPTLSPATALIARRRSTSQTRTRSSTTGSTAISSSNRLYWIRCRWPITSSRTRSRPCCPNAAGS